MIVGCFQRIDVFLPHRARIPQIATAPGKARASETSRQDVGHKPRPAPIAVREWMNGDKRVVKANDDLVERKGLVINPEAGVIQDLVQTRLDEHVIDAEVGIGRAVLARPAPHFAEHSSVQLSNEGLADRVVASLERPHAGGQDVRLFKLIQFPAQCDVRRNQVSPLVSRDESGIDYLLI